MILTETEILCEDTVVASTISNIMATAKRVFTASPEISKQQIAIYEKKQLNDIAEIKKTTGVDITSVIKTAADSFRDSFSFDDPAMTKDTVVKIINESFLDTFKRSITAITEATGKDVGLAVVLLATAIVINTVAMTIFAVLIGPNVAVLITVIFIAPFVEETMRNVALRTNGVAAGATFTAVMNAYEMVTYVSRMLKAGASLIGAVVLRVLAALMHQFVLTVQTRGRAASLAGLEKNGTQSSYLLAICIHTIWNLVSVIFNAQISRMVGIRTESTEFIDDELDLNVFC